MFGGILALLLGGILALLLGGILALLFGGILALLFGGILRLLFSIGGAWGILELGIFLGYVSNTATLLTRSS